MKEFIQTHRNLINKIFQIFKWLILLAFLFLAFRYMDFNEMLASLQMFSIRSLLLFIGILFISRLLYAWRWQVIGKFILPEARLSLYFYFQTNTLAEFVSIVMPSSVGGEVTRVIKMNSKGNKTTLSTAIILIDRASGALSMALVSIAALLLMGQKIEIPIHDWLSQDWVLPVILVVIVLIGIGVYTYFRVIQNDKFKQKMINAWEILSSNLDALALSILISIVAHIIFSLSHYFIFNEIYPLNPVELVAIVLTPQLARTIPISVLGFSPGEGMMVASQMMVGIPRETALVITLITLTSRYFFALVGFLLELLTDGIGFFKKARKTQEVD